METFSVPPMLFVASGALAITLITLTNRKAVHASGNLWGVLAANYAMALALSLVMASLNGLGAASTFTLILGLVTGFLYTGGMFLSMKTIGRRGASIAASASQLSLAIPVSLSLVVYGESLGINQVAGVAIALVALPLLASRKGAIEGGSIEGGTIMLLLALLTAQGFAQFSSKVLVASNLQAERGAFFIAVFTSATLITVPAALRRSGDIGRADLGYGVLIGTCNIGGNLSIILALISFPGAVVFPLVSSGGLLMVTTLTTLLYRERMAPMNALGVALTLLSVVLINIQLH